MQPTTVGENSGSEAVPVTAALRMLADTARLIAWMSNASHSCIYLNPSAAALLDNPGEFDLPSWRQLIHPEDRSRFDAAITQAHACYAEYHVEYRLMQSDGSVRWMLTSGSPRFNVDGGFEGFNGTVIDVSDRYRTLDILAKSEAEHRLLIEHCPNLISHNTVDGIYLNLSPAYRHILGYEPAELVGINAFSLIHPEDQESAWQVFRQHSDAGWAAFEYRKKHKAGHYVWLKTHISMLPAQTRGQRGTMVAVSHEIGAEVRLREQLQQTLEKFRSLTSLSSDWYWETDAYGRFAMVSEGIIRIAGVRPEQLMGKHRADLVTDPDDPDFLEYLAKVAARQPFHDLQWSCRLPGNATERYLRISGEPVFRGDSFCGYRGISHDVTDAIITQRQNDELAAENHAIIANSLDIIALIDKEGRILRINEAVRDILGYEPEDVLDQSIFSFIVPEDKEPTLRVIESLRENSGSLENFDNTYRHKNGSHVRLSWTAYWGRGNNYMYATGRNVTDRHKARLALQQANRQLISVLERIGDAFFSVDSEWRIIYANQKALAFSGMAGADVAGRSMHDLFPEFFTSSFYPILQEAMGKDEPTFFEDFYEPYGRWVEVRAYPSTNGLSLFYRDITDERQVKETIRRTEQRLQKMIERTPAAYLLADGAGAILDANPALSEMCGYAREEILRRNILDLFPVAPCGGALLQKNGLLQIDGQEATLYHKDGHLLHVLVNASVDRDHNGNTTYLTAFLTDITERREAAERLQHLATHDVLTGLPNRAFLNERLQAMLDTAPRGEINAVMLIDLDRFKEINDSMGHEAGDILLQEIAQRLKNSLRPGDIAVRLGGDEFVVVAHCASGAESAARIAEKLCAAVALPIDIAGTRVVTGASVGISLFPQDGKTGRDLLQHADAAMYKVKQAGRNGYRFFTEDMVVEVRAKVEMESALHEALQRNEFELHYQPRINLKTGGIAGMEALIRWRHPKFGQVMPQQFIPLAEENGLIESIGHWVLQQACQDTRHLINMYGQPLSVSVNLSPRQLRNDHLQHQVRDALTGAGLPADLLELELTETALMDGLENTSQALEALKRIGIRLSVDDFGTGHSSVAYLRYFPLDAIKLDQSFLKPKKSGVDSSLFIQAFIDMAHTLKLSVVAEGIEMEETRQFLRGIDCDEGQGYLFSRPLSLKDMEAFLTRCQIRETIMSAA